MTDFIVDPIVEVATDVINALGLPGIFILMALESACIPVPSEAIMLFAGFNVAEGEMTLLGITVAGVLGNIVGSWAAWAAGYYGRVELLERNRLIHVNRKHLEWADRWFHRHGEMTVLVTRCLPIIRTFISLPAGIAKMPFWRFTIYTAIGCVPWVLMLGYIGKEVGARWEEWRDYLHYGDYLVLAGIVGLVAYLLVRRRRNRSGSGGDMGAGAGEETAAGEAEPRAEPVGTPPSA